MERIRIDDVDPVGTTSPADLVKPLAPQLGATDVAINHFELAPGDAFGFALHRHLDQEELFYVQRGTATFATDDGDVTVGAGEMVRFAPGEFQLGRNDGPDRVVALAIGAPGETHEIEYRRPCPDCGEDTIQRPDVDREAMVVRLHCDTCERVVEEHPMD